MNSFALENLSQEHEDKWSRSCGFHPSTFLMRGNESDIERCFWVTIWNGGRTSLRFCWGDPQLKSGFGMEPMKGTNACSESRGSKLIRRENWILLRVAQRRPQSVSFFYGGHRKQRDQNESGIERQATKRNSWGQSPKNELNILLRLLTKQWVWPSELIGHHNNKISSKQLWLLIWSVH